MSGCVSQTRTERFHLRPKRLAAALLPLLLPLCACRPYHMYEGRQRPENEIASIRHSKNVVLMEIDGGDTGVSDQFRLLPGEHAMSVQVYEIGSIRSAYTGHPAKETRRFMCTCELRFHTAAGARYFVDARELSDDVWIAWIKPLDTDEGHEPDAEDLPHCTCRA